MVGNPVFGIVFNRSDTAIVFIDPQNKVLSEKGRAWGAVGKSVTEPIASHEVGNS